MALQAGMKPADFQKVTSLFKRTVVAPMAVLAAGAAAATLSKVRGGLRGNIVSLSFNYGCQHELVSDWLCASLRVAVQGASATC